MNRSILATVTVLGLITLYSCSQSSGRKIGENNRESASDRAVVSKADISDADIVWTGSKVTGGKHSGTLQIKNNNLEFKDGQLIGGFIEVDMKSLKNTDLEGEWKQKLENHLNSDDFFSTEKHPTSTLIITTVRSGKAPNTLDVTGNLTIKETTLAETFKVAIEEVGNEIVYSAILDIDRTKYDVKYGSSNFFEGLGDKAINNNFTLDVKIVIVN